MTAKELDELFEQDEEFLPCLDLTTMTRPGLAQQNVEIAFPSWMIGVLDQEAYRLGIDRQAIIKVWLAERIK